MKLVPLAVLSASILFAGWLRAEEPGPWVPQGEDEWKTTPKTEAGKDGKPPPIEKIDEAKFPEIEAAVMKAMEKSNPDMLRKLTDMKEVQPTEYRAQILEAYQKLDQKKETPKQRWGDDNRPQRNGQAGPGAGAPGDQRNPGFMGGRNRMDQFRQVEEFLSKNDPEELERLKKLREEDMRAFLLAAADLPREIERIQALEKQDPERYNLSIEIFKLDSKSKRLAEALRLAKNDPEKAKALQTELQDLLGKCFEYKEKLRALEAEQLKKDLAEMERLQKVRTENRNEIIRRRLDQLTDNPEFAW